MNKKKLFILLTIFLSLWFTGIFPALAEEGHSMGDMGHSMNKGGHKMDMKVLRVDEYIISYSFMTTAEHHKMMQDMKMDMSKLKMEPNATHHLALEISEEKGGEKIEDAKVKVKVIEPNDKAQEKLVEWGKEMNHYGCDLEMKEKGKYGVIVLFKTKDEKQHLAKFWYEVK